MFQDDLKASSDLGGGAHTTQPDDDKAIVVIKEVSFSKKSYNFKNKLCFRMISRRPRTSAAPTPPSPTTTRPSRRVAPTKSWSFRK